jgi:hypothetical protein
MNKIISICLFIFYLFSFTKGIESFGQATCTLSTTATSSTCVVGNNGTVTATINGSNAPIGNCVTPALPGFNESCNGNCNPLITPFNINTNITAGTNRACVQANNYHGSIQLNFGTTVIICGQNVQPSNISFNGGTLIVLGSVTITNVNFSSGTIINYGTLTFNGLLANSFNISISNEGIINIPFGDFGTGYSGTLTNNNLINVSSGNFINHHTTTNSGTINVSGALTNDYNSGFTNNCTLNVGADFTNNGSFTNAGKINVTANTLHSYSNTLVMQANSVLNTVGLTIQGTINGNGASCSLIKSTGNISIVWGAVLSGSVFICRNTSASLTNQPGIAASFFSCSACNPTLGTSSFIWRNSANVIVGTTAVVNNLPAGTYAVQASNTGCSNNPLLASVTINAISNPLIVNPSKTDITCFGSVDGSITASVSGGTPPYSITWKNSSNVTIGNTATVNNLPAGTYSVQVQDASCTITPNPVTITAPTAALTTTIATTDASCYGCNDGNITPNINGGSSPYTYSLENSKNVVISGGISILSNLLADTYTLTITDVRTCKVIVSSIVINQPPPIVGYSELKKDLDGDYFNVLNNQLWFKYIEKYSDGGVLNYQIYDYARNKMVSAASLTSPKVGANFYQLDLKTITSFNAKDFTKEENTYYILEVLNAKGEKFQLRFKYIPV